MCGIVGYIGKKDIDSILLDGLKELEYRGYDSAGIATIKDDEFVEYKAVGKIKNLRAKMAQTKTDKPYSMALGIGHTRWATHGKPTELNAHPHLGEYSYVVHNGIIENYKELKQELTGYGKTFVSQTDTEVIAHMFEYYFDKLKDPKRAFDQTISRLKGAYSILLISKVAPKNIFFIKHGSPLAIATCDSGEYYIASSETPLIGVATKVIHLEDGDSGVISCDDIQFFEDSGATIKKNTVWQDLPISKLSAQKDGYRFFMEKETYEQSDVIADTMMGRIGEDQILFDELDENFFDGINRLQISACGTSYHAALVSKYLFERLTKIPCDVEVASEFRYKQPLLSTDSLFIAISQSGETADTMEALKMAKKAGQKTLCICNVDSSSMTRLADKTLLLRAGIEKAVASTKAFSTQVVMLWMMSLYIAKTKNTISKTTLDKEIKALKQTPKYLKVDDQIHQKCQRLSKRYLHGHGFFFIGRDIFYPLSLEGALKLKEISYIHAQGYPAGEMKHGPIALADEKLFTVALMPQSLLLDKVRSNVEELIARDSVVLALSPQKFELADDYIKTKASEHYMHEFFAMLVVLQLFSMELSVRLGNDVDMPRNLAKSVTVE